METNSNQAVKQAYNPPRIAQIALDNEISLALASYPAPGPGEPGYVSSLSPDYFTNDPFHPNQG